MNILLQILDEGKTNDAHGRTVSFANTVIIMTSNAGSQKAEASLGFGKSAKDISKEKVLKALNEFLRPEFIGRVDEIVVFNPLVEEDYKKIAILMINEMKTVLKDKGIEFIYDENTP
jgi:ATP-dependent Clp protease ATP-binding subunit ClpA